MNADKNAQINCIKRVWSTNMSLTKSLIVEKYLLSVLR